MPVPRPTTGLRAAPLLLLLVALLAACGSAPITPTPAAGSFQAPTVAAAATTTTAPAAIHALAWTIEAVEKPALDPPAGAGREWLLVRVRVTNPGAKAAIIRERQVTLTVDGASIAPDGPAIDKAERAGKGRGFGDIIGAAISAGKADTRIAVFGVPIGARQFSLVLHEEKTGTALAPPADLAALVAQAPAPVTPTPVPSPTAKPPVVTATTPPAAVPAPIARESATVVEVVDGDTIKVRLADGRLDTVRYIGVDTPETKDPRTSVECFGVEAAAKNAELVGGRAVELEKDISERDKYDRLLRYVWVAGDDGNVRHANEELVKWGFAAASSYPPDVRFQEQFGSLQRAAQAQQLGLWGSCASAHAPLPTAVPPTTTPRPAVPTPTTRPPAATTAPQPAAPSAAFQLVASVSNASPTKNSTVAVTARLTQNGQGVPGATMRTVWNYKTTESACEGGPSGATGSMTCERKISQATAGYTVVIDVMVTYQGQYYRTTTSFTPR
jgi:micrococcal nuclease